jgi:mRNA-degrading endonuclease RelE of RelBE toxin-antitoxin system
MSYEIIFQESFEDAVRPLKKRFRRIADDLADAIALLQENPTLGSDMGHGVYKARVANRDVKRGKSGGYRLIYSQQCIGAEKIIFSALFISYELATGSCLFEGDGNQAKDSKNRGQRKGQVIEGLFDAAARAVNVGAAKGATQSRAGLPLD